MTCLIDTNILTRWIDSNHVLHRLAVDSVARLKQQNDVLVLVPQCCYEFWVVVTRPKSTNRLGLSASDAAAKIDQLTRLFPLLEDVPAILSVWNDLVRRHSVTGKNTHDARLVAAMNVHGVERIL